ncbi:MAG: hypothetical protein RMJ59_04410 [Candidatus Nitrosocaldus sp.]|nr:hypothetical protein [Candidatus Nitrosocaldus sp.]MDW8275608.1 hypothetical protein [Candidatus Nitrosocaldus sp.]
MMRNLSILAAVVAVIVLFSTVGMVYAQEEVVDRSALAWGLFYKMMTAAFIVGAIVQGTLVYIIFKFKEKKVKERAEISR